MRQKKAVLTFRPAKFTAHAVYNVLILNENHKVNGNDWGIVFIANYEGITMPKDTSQIKLEWFNNDTLKIIYNPNLNIHLQVIKKGDYYIVYETMENSKLPK